MPKLVPSLQLSEGPRWQSELASSLRNVRQLAQFLQLSATDIEAVAAPDAADFPLRVPLSYARRMRKGDRSDPLLLQVLPSPHEAEGAGSADPLDERGRQPQPGLVAKYQGRVLWMLTGACAVHCRYCFRRHLPYGEMASGRRGAAEVLDWLRRRKDITEVIFSGGDPLSLPDPLLRRLAESLAGISHLRTLRLHTRMPVVLPSRVDKALLGWLADCPLNPVIVLHINHSAEINSEVADAVAALQRAGARLYAQSVLLAGINDAADRLAGLCDRLWEAGVQPYYLHLLDPVKGAAHFDVPAWRAQLLYGDLCARLPGYRLPKLVRETPGLPAKSLVPPVYCAVRP